MLPVEWGTSTDLLAGIPVSDYAAAVKWYERLFRAPPSFVPTDGEAVWEFAAHRYVLIEEQPERGLTPAERETYTNGVRKAAYRDPDGNRFEFGGAPLP